MNRILARLLTFWIPNQTRRRLIRNILLEEVSKKEKLTKPYKKPSSIYKNLVVSQGFCYTGSGALLALLAECNNTTVFAFHDKETKGGGIVGNDSEVDIFRGFGGVLDLSNAFLTTDRRNRDFKLKTFIHFTEFLFCKGNDKLYNDYFLSLSKEFISELIQYKIETDTGVDFYPYFRFSKTEYNSNYENLESPFSQEYPKKHYLYYLKDIEINEYIEKAKKFIKNWLQSIESKENLILDQFFSDGSSNFELYEKYVDNYKIVSVYRDPRDVYVQRYENSPIFVDPRYFVKTYSEALFPALTSTYKNHLAIRFEDLIFNYKKTTSAIFEFLNFDPTCHIYPNRYFVRNISEKNVGIYKKYKDKKVIKTIESLLPKLLFNY